MSEDKKLTFEEMIERAKSLVAPLILVGRQSTKVAMHRENLLARLSSVCATQVEADTLRNTIENLNIKTYRLGHFYEQLAAGKPAQELIEELLQEWDGS